MNTKYLQEELREIALPLSSSLDLEELIESVGDKRYVLLGEGSHGTHEYYSWRIEIAKRLIKEKGFSFIAVEGDWPDCYLVNRYVKGYKNAGKSAYDVLNVFNRWPTWMWANKEIVGLTEWLKDYNQKISEEKRVGFYGLDVYSLWESMYVIMHYLKEYDPDAIPTAMKAYHCFEPYAEDVQEYARATAFVPHSCEEEVVSLLTELQEKKHPLEDQGQEHYFNAEQNAEVLKNAEEYYRTMIYGGPDSWNLRDTHMTQTLDRLMEYYGKDAKGIVFAHNTHVGDARYTDMADVREVNIGQLVRQEHHDDGVCLVGFGSYQGSVIAGQEWGAPMQKMVVPQAKEGSIEYLLHQVSRNDKLLVFDHPETYSAEFLRPIGNRAIGVVYNPHFEAGNYVPSIIPRRYDAFLYIDVTKALSPLHAGKYLDGELPETYPFAV